MSSLARRHEKGRCNVSQVFKDSITGCSRNKKGVQHPIYTSMFLQKAYVGKCLLLDGNEKVFTNWDISYCNRG